MIWNCKIRSVFTEFEKNITEYINNCTIVQQIEQVAANQFKTNGTPRHTHNYFLLYNNLYRRLYPEIINYSLYTLKFALEKNNVHPIKLQYQQMFRNTVVNKLRGLNQAVCNSADTFMTTNKIYENTAEGRVYLKNGFGKIEPEQHGAIIQDFSSLFDKYNADMTPFVTRKFSIILATVGIIGISMTLIINFTVIWNFFKNLFHTS